MSLAAKKEAVRSLMKEKTELEKKIEDINSFLGTINQPDVLVDAQGFPRADVDVNAVAAARHDLIYLQNDHKALMTKLEKALFAMHAQAKKEDPAPKLGASAPPKTHLSAAFSSTSSAASPSYSPDVVLEKKMPDAVAKLRPFYLVDQVFEDSPAQSAGLRIGDRVLKFGNASHSAPSALVAEVKNNVGKPIPVLVHRNPDGVLALTLTPQSWPGKGLLGCHLTPIKQ